MNTDNKLNLKVKMTFRPNGIYHAELGNTGWCGESPSKLGALELLAHDLTSARRNEFRRAYARANRATFCLYWAGGGWAYDIVRDDNPNRASTACFGLDSSFESCKAKMLAHVAQWNESNPAPLTTCWGGAL